MLFKVDVFSFCLDNVPTDKPTDYETILTKPNKYSIFNNGDSIPKTENVNIQTKLKPLWFGLFLIVRLAAHVSNG